MVTGSNCNQIICNRNSGYVQDYVAGEINSGTKVAIDQKVNTYDQYGRAIKTVQSYIADSETLKSLHLGGNIKTMVSQTSYIDDAKANSSEVAALFPNGALPNGIDLNAIRVVISTQTGTTVDEKDAGSLQMASITDKVTGKALYSLSDYENGHFSRVASKVYDHFNRAIKETDAHGESSSLSYSVGDNANAVTVVDPAGNKLVTEYNNLGAPIVKYSTDGSRTLIMAQNTYDYDQSANNNSGYGLLEQSIDLSGNTDIPLANRFT